MELNVIICRNILNWILKLKNIYKKIKVKPGVEYHCWLRSVRQEIMINASWKPKMGECQNCIRGALHQPFLFTMLLFSYNPLFLFFCIQTDTAATDSYRSVRANTKASLPSSPSLPKLWKRALPVWRPASRACRITKVWPGCVLEKETFNLLPFSAKVPS